MAQKETGHPAHTERPGRQSRTTAILAPTDTISHFQDAIRAAGMEPPPVIEPGKFHRFPGLGKTNGNRAGWCKLFPDGEGGVYGDFSSDTTAHWQANPNEPLTEEQRAARARCIEDAKTEALAERKANQAKAACCAAKVWETTRHVDTHPYLTRKKIKPWGSRQYEGNVVVPVYGPEGLQSLQTISDDGGKKFLPGGRIAGGYYWLKEDANTIALCEGFATAASVAEAVPCGVLCCFTAVNLSAIASMIRKQNPRSRIIIAGDDDSETDGNPGRTKATEAARRVDGIAVFPPDGGDWNDYHAAAGIKAVTDAFETHIQKTNPRGNGKEQPIQSDLQEISINPPCFMVHEDWCQFKGKKLRPGLWWHGIKETREGIENTHSRVSSPLYVKAITSGFDGGDFGRLLRFRNSHNHWCEWAMPMQMLKGSGEEMRGELLDQGVTINPDRRNLLSRYIMECHPERKVIAATSVGWHGNTFVLPDRVIGKSDVIFQSEHAKSSDITKGGTADAWFNEIGRLCVGNDSLVVSVAAALAGPLLKYVSHGGCGIHWYGRSSTGKSTILAVAASVWGPNEFLKSWSTTANGFEGAAAARNDMCLILDEINEASPHEVGRIAYMLANGQGKQRANRTGSARPIQRWKLIAISSGEETLSNVMLKAGTRSNTGQHARLASIPVDFEYGAFSNLFGHAGGNKPADHLRVSSQTHYGHIGPAFLERLIVDDRDLSDAYERIKDALHGEAEEAIEYRVASGFALIGLAGELATEFGLLPWPVRTALDAVKRMFVEWRNAQGKAATEEARVLESVEAFIGRHGDSRFSDVLEDVQRSPVHNRAGWYKVNGKERTYLFLKEALIEAGGNYELRTITAVLDRAGWIASKDTNRMSSKVRVPGRRLYLYHIRQPKDAL